MDEPRDEAHEADQQEALPEQPPLRVRVSASLGLLAQSTRALGRRVRLGAGRLVRASRKPALVVLGVIAVSVVMGVGAYAATGFYGQFGSPRTAGSIRFWQARPATYLASDCRGCHADPAAQAATGSHRDLLCESCHVPSVDHPGPVAGVVQVLPPATSSDCVACHAATAGRPASAPSVELDAHYAGAECVACHQPHSAVAIAPRAVTHPLAQLPECIVCHSPVGLKRFPANHEAVPDETCLACHRIGAGGDE